MIAIRSPGCGGSEHEQRERHRRHALRPEPRHERLAGGVHLTGRPPALANITRAWRPCRSSPRSQPPPQPSLNSVSSVKIAPNTRNTPSLTTSATSSERISKTAASVRAPDPERDRFHEHRDEAIALGRQHRGAVRGEGHAERVERLQCKKAPAPRHQARRHEGHRQAGQHADEHVPKVIGNPTDEVARLGRCRTLAARPAGRGSSRVPID